MNKKSAILFFSVLVLLSLGVIYVFGDLYEGSETNTNVTTADPNKWLKGGNSQRVNITLGFNAARTTGFTNLTNFSVAIDENNFSSWNFLDDPFGVLSSAAAVELGDGSNESNNITNMTFDSAGGVFGGNAGSWKGDWACYNITPMLIECNATEELAFVRTTNASITLTFNVTGASIGDEAAVLWNITAWFEDNGVFDEVTSNFTNVTTYVDDRKPRLIEVNISDGNTTYSNTTFIGGATDTVYFIRKDQPLTIKALIEDALLDTAVVLAYSCNGSDPVAYFEPTSRGYAVEQVLKITDAYNQSTLLGYRGYVYSTTVDCSAWELNGANETLTFTFLANDSFNHSVVFNNTDDTAFNITLDDGELLPGIGTINVTQTTIGAHDGVLTYKNSLSPGAALDGSSDYLAANELTFTIEVTGGYKPENVTIAWNETTATSATVTDIQPVIGGDWIVTKVNLSETTVATNITTGAGIGSFEGDQAILNETTVLYSTTLDLQGNNSNYLEFWVVVNNTGNNYTRLSGPHKFYVDGSAPLTTITSPDDTTITPRGSITFTCAGSEAAGSGAQKVMWELKKPSETVYTKKQDYENLVGGSDSVAFTGDDTNLAGEYSVICTAIDVVGNEGTSSVATFSVHYSTGEGGAGEGAAAADIDLSTQEEMTITEKQGVISTFTLDGTTIHTIKIKTVDEVAGTVTIVIESDPIEITLKIGETKEVDIDADGANDISVTLNKITDGAADITTKRLTPLPEKGVPTEEVPPTEKPAEEITPTEAASKTWLWILIIVIIVVIGVGYWFMKRK